MKIFRSVEAIVSGQDIVPLMRAMPQLTEFIIYCNCIPESAFIAMNSEGLVPGLRVFREWEAPSVQTAVNFLESRWSRDEHGRYDGICDAKFCFKEESGRLGFFQNTDKNNRSVLQHLQQHGRKVETEQCFSNRRTIAPDMRFW